jgi:rare lipoprotein A
MRPELSPRSGGLAGVLLTILIAASAAPAQAEPAPSPVGFTLSDASLTYGQRTVAGGTLGRDGAGRRVVLELRGASGAWTEIAAGTAGADGAFRVRARVPRSGAVRVTAPAAAATATTAAARERRVRVAPALRVGSRRLQIRAGRRATVSGMVRPGVAGLAVALQIRRGSRWITLDRARTASGGRYALGDRRRSTGSARARLEVSGARAGVATVRRSLGRLDVFRSANASWYGPGLYGNRLGCGGTLGAGTLGVANKTLPCGTMVTFRHGSRSVRVPVIDRGPYVGGREYDLTAATKDRIGFSGHGSVLATR